MTSYIFSFQLPPILSEAYLYALYQLENSYSPKIF